MSVKTYLDVSTGHVTQQDCELLAKQGHANPLIAYGYPSGYFVPLSGDFLGMQDTEQEQEFKAFGYSQQMLDLIAFALGIDIYMLRIDSDGELIPALEFIAW